MIPQLSLPDNVAILIPCYNEEQAIGKVIADCKKHLPGAEIYVFDNNSTDNTAQIARENQVHLQSVIRQGKGHVIAQAFDSVEADIYIMIDGDDTYSLEDAEKLALTLVRENLDMVIGMRLKQYDQAAFPRFHVFGNWLFSYLVSLLFGHRITDMLSGYRVFSRQFVKSVPLKASGFEIETELTAQAIAKGFNIKEVPTTYKSRYEGSVSKLKTYTDGWRILKVLVLMFKDLNPLLFFSFLALASLSLSLIAGWKPIEDFVTHKYVYHVPRAVLAAALGIVTFIMLSIGIVLHTLQRYHVENFHLQRRILKK